MRKHHLQRKRRPPSLGTRLVADGSNQGEKKIPQQRGLHLLQDDLPPRLLLGVDMLNYGCFLTEALRPLAGRKLKLI